MTYRIGNLFAAYMALSIPLGTALVLWYGVWLRREAYRRRYYGWRLVWERWISTALLTGALFGLFGWYLFWRPFYAVTVGPNNQWSISYVLPPRVVRLAADDISGMGLEDERLPFPRAGRPRQHIRVELHNGATYTSAPAAADEATRLLTKLRALLSPGS